MRKTIVGLLGAMVFAPAASASPMEETWPHIRLLGEQVLSCIVEEAHSYEYSNADDQKSEERFHEDYEAHVNEACEDAYHSLEAALEDSSMDELTREVYQDTLHVMHHVVIARNAARYWDFYNPE